MPTIVFCTFNSRPSFLPPLRWAAVSTAAWLALQSAPGYAATLNLPNAGGLLRGKQMQPDGVALKAESQLRITPRAEPAQPQFDSVQVKGFAISGNTIFDNSTLQSLLASAIGQSLTPVQLRMLVARIDAHYQQAGYSLAHASVAQGMADGVVRIEVQEPRLGEVRLDNRSRVGSAHLENILANLPRGKVLRTAEVEGVMLRFADVLGTRSSAVLAAGQKAGNVDLSVQVQPTAAVQGTVALDNYGNRYTGRERLGAELVWNNPLHRGDALAVSALTTGPRLTQGSVGYELPLDARGDTLGVAFSTLQYTLGDSAAYLQGHGSAERTGLWFRRSFVRSKDLNLSAQLAYESLKLRDDADAPTHASQADRSLTLWTAQARLDRRDTFLGGGSNVANLAWHSGRVNFDNAASSNLDALTARTQGEFNWGALSLARTQSLGESTSLLASYNVQWADRNLDVSQKFSLGGMRNVRAYESDALLGDSGQSIGLELRKDLPLLFGPGRWQGLLFWDYGQVRQSQKIWNTADNNANISGAGLGLQWRGPQGLKARLTYAKTLGTTPSQLVGADAAHESVWLEIGADF